MSTSQKRSPSARIVIGLASIALVSISTYLYSQYSKTVETATTTALAPDVQRKRKLNPTTTLAISSPFIPDISVLSALSANYVLHLILPSELKEDATVEGMDSRRVIYHETIEGKLHIARALGGIYILVISESSSAPSTADEELVKFIKDVKAFVRDVIILDVSPILAEETRGAMQQAVEKNGGRFVRDWEELNDLLGI